MDFGMNVQEEEDNEEYDNACNNMAQSDLAQQNSSDEQHVEHER